MRRYALTVILLAGYFYNVEASFLSGGFVSISGYVVGAIISLLLYPEMEKVLDWIFEGVFK